MVRRGIELVESQHAVRTGGSRARVPGPDRRGGSVLPDLGIPPPGVRAGSAVERSSVRHRMADRKSNPFRARPGVPQLKAVKTILVTGASGFIGRLCVPLLAAKNYEVHAVTRRRHSFGWPSNVSVHQTDLLRPGNSEPLVRHLRPDA